MEERRSLLAHGAQLRPAYTTTGERVPDEIHLDLPGYPGGRDTIGNWVNKQFQLDAFGEALLLQALHGFCRVGLGRAQLEVTAQNDTAIRLYRRLGFRRSKTLYKAVPDWRGF